MHCTKNLRIKFTRVIKKVTDKHKAKILKENDKRVKHNSIKNFFRYTIKNLNTPRVSELSNTSKTKTKEFILNEIKLVYQSLPALLLFFMRTPNIP